MEVEVITALIAAGAALMGGLVTFGAGLYSARAKAAQLETEYQRSSRREVLQSARLHLQEVYIPLGEGLGLLTDGFERLKRSVSVVGREVDPESLSHFRTCIEVFLEVARDLRIGAKGLYLTPEIDSALSSFQAFLTSSLDASEPTTRVVYKVRIGGALSLTRERRLSGNFASALPVRMFTLGAFGQGLTVQVKETLSAPLSSLEFEEQMVGDLAGIQGLVKDVALAPSAI